MAKTVRIATEKTTGNRYIVQSLDFKANLAYCWGEVSKTSGLSATHSEGKRFPLDAVTIETVERTQSLLTSLFDQTIRGMRAQGYILSESGRKHRYVHIHGKA